MDPLELREEVPADPGQVQLPGLLDVIIEESESDGPVTRRSTFWGDILYSFVFLIEPANLSALFVCWFFTLVSAVLLLAGTQVFVWSRVFVLNIGLCVLGLLPLGWLGSYCMRIVLEVAGGDDELPGTISDGLIDATIRPLVVFLVTWLCLLSPAMLLVWLRYWANLSVPALWIQAAVILAVAMWPMAVLCVSIGGIGVFARADLMVYSVARTLVPYTVVWIILLGTGVGFYYLIEAIRSGVGGAPPVLGKHPLARAGLASLVLTYGAIVVMRVIGLYYRHFKHRFAWSWE